jgi:hypothetical protein
MRRIVDGLLRRSGLALSPPGSSRPASRTVDPQHLHSKYWVLLAFAVAVAFGPVTLVNQPFWDDWVVRAQARAGTLWEISKQAGTRELFVLFEPFASASDPRLAAVTQLLLFCALAPLIYTIVRRATRWPSQDAFWAALLTALAPLNQARFLAVTLAYAFACVCFAASLVLLLRDLDASSVGRRVLIALLLMMAFSTNSFLVLAWLPPALVAIDACRKTEHPSSFAWRVRAAALAVARRGELLLLPSVYWSAKKILEPTYGIYANYNKVQMGIPEGLARTVLTFIDQIRGADVLLPARSDLAELGIAAGAAMVLLAGAAWIWRLPIHTADEKRGGSHWFANGLAVTIALALIMSALFPYVLVDKAPRFSGLWETRNQTTLMLVSGFAIWVFLRLVIPRRFLSATAAIIAAGFLILDISVTHRIIADALEARTISNLFKEHPSPPGTMVFVIENDRVYRALGRFFAFYELSYFVNSSDTVNPRLAISNLEVLDPATGTYPTAVIPAVSKALVGLCQNHRSSPQFGFGGFVSNGTIETVTVIADHFRPGPFQTIREAIRVARTDGPEPTAAIRLVRQTAPIGGACVSPCCSDR